MTHWGTSRPLRREARFGDRIVRCYADRPGSIDAMFRAAVALGAERDALVFGDRRVTWGALDAAVDAIAASLRQRFGIGPGDRVGVYSGNRLEALQTFLATTRIGAVAVPLGERLRRGELLHMLADSGARLLVFDAPLGEHVPAPNRLSTLEHRVAFGGEARGAIAFSALLRPAAAAPAAVAEEETAFILYTSGTTGRPKGAMVTHLNVVHSVLHYVDCMGLTKDDRTLMAAPVAHVTGLVAQFLTMVGVGGRIVMVDGFKAGDALATIERERVTHAILVPAMYALMLREPDFAQRDLSSLRIGGFGGAPMPEATIAELGRRLPGLVLMNAYGATETASPATMLPPGRIAGHAHTVGVAVPCAEILVVDEDGRELPRGETGEIWIGGPMTVPGYWMDVDATTDSFTAGFWHSGDLGRIDADGYVEVRDRIKDMINRGGYKVYSAEVENVLAQHPHVVECAVVSEPCPVLGERVHAFVVVAGTGTDDADLTRFCAERLADYKVPERFTRMERALPRNASGKIMKADLRYAAARAGG